MFTVLMPILYQLDVDEDDSTQFTRTVAGMITSDLNGRLTVLLAIEEFMALFNKLSPGSPENNLGPNESNCRLLLLSNETSAHLRKKELHRVCACPIIEDSESC